MIYILEDDKNIQKLLSYSLNTNGFECKTFSLPSDFWNELSSSKPRLILLDIMLPQEDGISILTKLRLSEDTKNIPIIMLTAKDSELDITTGLDLGADDYVTKPFGINTLISRIKAVLRRYENSDNNKIITYKNIKININKHSIFLENEQIFLTIKEFDLLVLLLQNKGNVISREQILNKVWNMGSQIESRTVDMHIKTLRQKLKSQSEIIQTIRGVGYIIANEE